MIMPRFNPSSCPQITAMCAILISMVSLLFARWIPAQKRRRNDRIGSLAITSKQLIILSPELPPVILTQFLAGDDMQTDHIDLPENMCLSNDQQ